MICKTFNRGEIKDYKYVVVLSRYNGKILLSRHKERMTWETQGGHIEEGETPMEAAKRELYEESGAIQYEIASVCDYWAGDTDMKQGAGGVVFTANIHTLGTIPDSEMQEVETFDQLPENLTYSEITPVLFAKFKQINKQLLKYEKVELWDAYKADETLKEFTKTEDVLIRGEKVPDGLCHAVAEVFVMHEDGSILLMRRDLNKTHYPGFWESGAGGAILKGESFINGAKRELLEETGILADDLVPNYTIFFKDRFYKGYVCRTNMDKDALKLQEGETIDYKWVDANTFLDIFKSDQFITSLKGRLNEFVQNHFSLTI